MTGMKNGRITQTKNKISSLVSFLIGSLISVHAFGEFDFDASLQTNFYPSQSSAELLSFVNGNWTKESYDWKFQARLQALGLKGKDYSQGYLDCSECHAQKISGANTFRFGWQIIHWGITDGYNPLNRINSKFFLNPLHPSERGEPMVNWSYIGSQNQIQFLYIPTHQRTELPGEKSFWLPNRITASPGSTKVTGVIPDEFNYVFQSRQSLNKAEQNNFAVQWTTQQDKYELGINYYDGMATVPLFVANVTGSFLDADPDHMVIRLDSDLRVDLYDYRVQSLGSSFLWNFDTFIFKWEGLHTSPVGTDILIPEPQFEQVFALERNWNVGTSAVLTSVMQYSHVNIPQPPESRAFSSLGFFEQTGMVGARFNWNEVWTLTGFMARQFKNQASMSELKLSYSADSSEFSMGGTMMDGPDTSLIGLWRDNDFAFLSAKILF
jgi:hypothetical protein